MIALVMEVSYSNMQQVTDSMIQVNYTLTICSRYASYVGVYFANNTAGSKYVAHFKSGRKWLQNNNFDTFTK